ncbi:MAG: permease [Planctomycetales bacterium]|nr:permease [Planctomycetales bacterium]
MAELLGAMWNVLLELAPWLLLGAGVAGILHVLLPGDFLQRQFSGRLGVVKAVALGVPLPLCSCGVIPVGLSLKKGGGTHGATVAFLISTPQTGVDSIFVSASMLGWPFALFKLCSAAATGIIGGWLTDTGKYRGTTAAIVPPLPAAPVKNRPKAIYEHAIEMLQSIWRWVAVGIVVSAAITIFVPADAFAALEPLGGIAAMLITLLISLPLYVCATASVPIAAALVASGLPTGAALVFLMAGPATNVATLGAVYHTLGKRSLSIYLATVIVGSVACGWLFDFVIDADSAAALHQHHTMTWWSVASAVVLLLLFAKFARADINKWLKQRTSQEQNHRPATRSFGVRGMKCLNCVAKLEATLKTEANIEDATVSLDPGRIDIRGSVTESRVRELVSQAGFEVE